MSDYDDYGDDGDYSDDDKIYAGVVKNTVPGLGKVKGVSIAPDSHGYVLAVVHDTSISVFKVLQDVKATAEIAKHQYSNGNVFVSRSRLAVVDASGLSVYDCSSPGSAQISHEGPISGFQWDTWTGESAVFISNRRLCWLKDSSIQIMEISDEVNACCWETSTSVIVSIGKGLDLHRVSRSGEMAKISSQPKPFSTKRVGEKITGIHWETAMLSVISPALLSMCIPISTMLAKKPLDNVYMQLFVDINDGTILNTSITENAFARFNSSVSSVCSVLDSGELVLHTRKDSGVYRSMELHIDWSFTSSSQFYDIVDKESGTVFVYHSLGGAIELMVVDHNNSDIPVLSSLPTFSEDALKVQVKPIQKTASPKVSAVDTPTRTNTAKVSSPAPALVSGSAVSRIIEIKKSLPDLTKLTAKFDTVGIPSEDPVGKLLDRYNHVMHLVTSVHHLMKERDSAPGPVDPMLATSLNKVRACSKKINEIRDVLEDFQKYPLEGQSTLNVEEWTNTVKRVQTIHQTCIRKLHTQYEACKTEFRKLESKLRQGAHLTDEQRRERALWARGTPSKFHSPGFNSNEMKKRLDNVAMYSAEKRRQARQVKSVPAITGINEVPLTIKHTAEPTSFSSFGSTAPATTPGQSTPSGFTAKPFSFTPTPDKAKGSSESAKPSFGGLGGTDSSKPAFGASTFGGGGSFGTSKPADTSSSAMPSFGSFSLDQKTDKSAAPAGSTAGEVKAANPTLFGASKAAPVSFGVPPTTSVGSTPFGATPATPKQDSDAAKPSPFGSSGFGSSSASSTGFGPTSFGAKPAAKEESKSETKQSTPSPFGFGSTSASKPPSGAAGAPFGAVPPAGDVKSGFGSPSPFGSSTSSKEANSNALGSTTKPKQTATVAEDDKSAEKPTTGFGSFGASSFGSTTAAAPFGSASVVPDTDKKSEPVPSSLFGSSAASSTTTFGSTAAAPFGSVDTKAAVPTTTSSPFGSVEPKGPAASSTTPSAAPATAPFGSMAPKVSTPAPFGSSSTAQKPFGSTSASSATNAFGSTNFGKSDAAAGTSFGSKPTNDTSTPGTPAAASTSFGASASSSTPAPFGSTSAPFGSNTATSSGSLFGQSTFGNKSTTPAASDAPVTSTITPASPFGSSSGAPSLFGSMGASTSQTSFGGGASAAPFGSSSVSGGGFGSPAPAVKMGSAFGSPASTSQPGSAFGSPAPAAFGNTSFGSSGQTPAAQGGAFGQAGFGGQSTLANFDPNDKRFAPQPARSGQFQGF